MTDPPDQITSKDEAEMAMEEATERRRDAQQTKRRRGLVASVKETYNEFIEKDAMSQAAAVAFYTGLSLAPLLTLIAWGAQKLFHQNAKAKIISAFEQVIGAQAAEPIRQVIDPASASAAYSMNLSGLISIGILLFSATGVFGQLQRALNHLWSVEPAPSAGWWTYVRKRLLSFGMLLTLAFLLLVSMVVSAVIQGIVGSGGEASSGWLMESLNIGVSLGIFVPLFALLFKYIPDARIPWRDVWVGAAITAVMFILGKFGLSYYLGRGSYQSSYGAAVGSFVALLVWVYYTSIIVFVGAAATQVYTRRSGDRIRPEAHAVRVEQTSIPKPA